MGKRRTNSYLPINAPLDVNQQTTLRLWLWWLWLEIGDATVAKVARQRLDEIIADPNRPPAADLIAGGQAFDALEEFAGE